MERRTELAQKLVKQDMATLEITKMVLRKAGD
jgi:hypothetical protein